MNMMIGNCCFVNVTSVSEFELKIKEEEGEHTLFADWTLYYKISEVPDKTSSRLRGAVLLEEVKGSLVDRNIVESVFGHILQESTEVYTRSGTMGYIETVVKEYLMEAGVLIPEESIPDLLSMFTAFKNYIKMCKGL